MTSKGQRGSSRKSRQADPKADAGKALHALGDTESGSVDAESDLDLESVLGRSPTADEVRSWQVLSPGLRRRAVKRIALMQRWVGERGDLTAVDAARIAEVTTKRFYQMASAWRKEPGLMAVGAYAAAAPDRPARIDPTVNAALQAEVPKVVTGGKGKSLEALRRCLEAAVRARLPTIGEKDGPRMPSPNVVRAVITREHARVADMKMLGESVVLDCCPTSMRAADGSPYFIFCLIDRGTLRILGQSLGSIDDSIVGYRRAAIDAIERIDAAAVSGLPWAKATRRIDIVVGTDRDAWTDRRSALSACVRPVDVELITRDRRFGSQFRNYVGERIGRIWLRPTWVSKPPPPIVDGDEIFTLEEAGLRAATEVSAWNTTKLIERDTGAATPPRGLSEALRFLAG